MAAHGGCTARRGEDKRREFILFLHSILSSCSALHLAASTTCCCRCVCWVGCWCCVGSILRWLLHAVTHMPYARHVAALRMSFARLHTAGPRIRLLAIFSWHWRSTSSNVCLLSQGICICCCLLVFMVVLACCAVVALLSLCFHGCCCSLALLLLSCSCYPPPALLLSCSLVTRFCSLHSLFLTRFAPNIAASGAVAFRGSAFSRTPPRDTFGETPPARQISSHRT